MIVLGIETSCDETAVALVRDDRAVLAEVLRAQWREHAAFGGVVPELAARAHATALDQLIAAALGEAGLWFDDLAGVAAAGGPGLIGGLLVGVMAAQTIAWSCDLPFIGVNHLEAHALTARLTDDVAFPYLLLLVSGGHCQLLIVDGVGRYRRLGTTLDDALGEAFDKVAKMLGLGYPGGPAIERAAETGDPRRFALPRPMRGREDCHFSFSGLKTAVKHALAALPDAERTPRLVADMSASFQAAAADCLVDRTQQAIRRFRRLCPAGDTLVIAGGVAANGSLRTRLTELAAHAGLRLVAPPPNHCTDNGVMIAWAGVERLRLGLIDDLSFAPRPRWPLDPSAAPVAFAGVKA